MANLSENEALDLFDNKVLARFWAKVEKTDSCWIWMASLSHGYGAFRVSSKVGSRSLIATRVSWALYHGRYIPDGMLICHHCDNPVCVNPEHLYAGTHMDNLRDAVVRGRRQPKTHCIRGHAFTAENLTDYKQCRECKKQYADAYGKTRIRNRRKAK